jgi:hypothetical protein
MSVGVMKDYKLKRSLCFNGIDRSFFYYESMKRELQTRPIYECRSDERLKTKPEESTRLVYMFVKG